MCEKGVFWNTMMVWKGWNADEERLIMGIQQRMVWKGYDEKIVQKCIKGI